jgi:uncharacterized protein (DUF2147 family)
MGLFARLPRGGRLVLAVAAVCSASGSGAASAAEINGFWLTADGEAVVEVLACNPPAQRCGRIVWLKKPLGADGKPLTDVNNPDAAQAKRGVCNLPIVLGMVAQADGSWDKGSGYDPDDGQKYTVAAKLLTPDQLSFSGYIGIKLVGRTETWTRAPDNLRGC